MSEYAELLEKPFLWEILEMLRYLCPVTISKTHFYPHFLMKPQIYPPNDDYELWDVEIRVGGADIFLD